LATALRELSLDEAKAKFEYLDARIVAVAWTKANPKAKKQTKKTVKKKEKTDDKKEN
jgi:hypothetical protein